MTSSISCHHSKIRFISKELSPSVSHVFFLYLKRKKKKKSELLLISDIKGKELGLKIKGRKMSTLLMILFSEEYSLVLVLN